MSAVTRPRVLICMTLVAGSAFVRGAAAQEAAAESAPRLAGQVLNHMGGGIKGAAVQVRFGPANADAGPRVETSTTDGLGDFSVPVPTDYSGKVTVIITLDGYTPHEQEIEIRPSSAPFAFAELEGAGSASGLVRRAETEAPIAGAHVVFSDGFKDWDARTDEAGNFDVGKLPPTELQLVVTADGFAEHRQDVSLEAREQRITVELGPEWVAEIRVVDGEKQPVADAVVEAIYSDNSQMRDMLTDASGLARFVGLPPQIEGLGVRVQHPDYASMTEFDVRVAQPTDGPVVTETVTLERGGIVRGRVTNASTGDPIMMARVRVGATMSDGAPMAWTDDEGRFEVTGVAAGRRVVTVHSPELAPTATHVDVLSGESSNVDFALEAGRAVRGRVTNPEGTAVGRATVMIASWRGFESLGLKAMTDDEGNFVIEDAPKDAFTVVAFAPGCEPAERDVPENAGPIELTLAGVKEPAPPLADGAVAPAVTMTATDGTDVSLAKLRGKFVFLDFWATWCGPCVVEMPNVAALHEATKARSDFVLIGVSLDSNRAALDKFVKEKGVGWLQVFGDGGAEAAAAAFGVRAIPATFLIGPDGNVIATSFHGSSMRENVLQRLSEHSNVDGG